MNAEGDTGEIADSKYRILECRTVGEKTCRSHSTSRYQIEDDRVGFFVLAEIVRVQYDFYGVPSFACSSTHRSKLFHAGWNRARGDGEMFHPFIPLEIDGHGTTTTSPRRSRMFDSRFFPAITSS